MFIREFHKHEAIPCDTVSVFANVPKTSKSSLGVSYMPLDDVVGRHWGTRGCHFMTS